MRVPAELRWEVRDKLDQSNINERTLSSGLDGLSRWIERYYTLKNMKLTKGRLDGTNAVNSGISFALLDA